MKQLPLSRTKKVRIGDKHNKRLPYKQLDLFGRGGFMPTTKVKDVVDVPTGDYQGTIVKNEVVKAGAEKFEYHQTTIRLDTKEKEELVLGVPFSISNNTLLGNILKKFGAKLEKDDKIDTDKYLMPKIMVKFSIVKKTVTGNSGSFEVCQIQADTLEPLKSINDVK